MNKGIDYGMGMSNRDHATGIRFGVISSRGSVLQAWWDTAEPVYGEAECPKCGVLIDLDEGADECPECGVDLSSEFDYAEPCAWIVDERTEDDPRALFAHCSEDGDIFVEMSPFFTYAQFCSPCAPGAVYLENPLSEPHEDNRGYCLDHTWFEEGVAPYPVYSVATGKLVEPEEEI